MKPLHELSLGEALDAQRHGDLKAADYLAALAARAAGCANLNAFIVPPEAAISSDSVVLPIAIKDNIATAGLETTCASRILRGFRPPSDATAVARLKASGAVVFGKTNLDEFAMGSSTEHSANGPTRNPWNLDLVPGGSSGGSAAAVAARVVPVALGSETGGSVRQPAAFCGVIGLKPTYGRVSRSGLIAFASSLDQIGIFSRTARDCAIVLRTIAGRDESDSTSSSENVPDYEAQLDRGIEGLRVGVISESFEGVDPEVAENFRAALDVLRGGGVIVETVDLPLIRHAVAVYSIVANAEASANLARFDGVRYGSRAAGSTLRQMYERTRGEGFGAEVKRRIMIGTFALSSGYYDAYYGRAQRARAAMTAEVIAALSRYDFLVTPTTPTPPFRLGEKLHDPLSMYLSDIFTAPANLTGIPAIAIPSGFTRDDLPLSLQVMGRPFAEASLLRVAHYFEEQTEYHRIVPRLTT